MSDHLRGRVFKRGTTWHMQVVNTLTGRIVAADNTGALPPMHDAATYATAAAREAWMRGMKPRNLRRHATRKDRP